MKVSAPGRICLFGEHQDYLGLPVIAMAISLRAIITGRKRVDNQVIIHKPDLNEYENFSLDDLTYSKSRDYFKSGIIVCQKSGLNFSKGFECEIKSNIPVRAGVSSSSAISTSWIQFLSHIADVPIKWNQKKIGELAYKSEVEEFNEPGGMMDQYTASIGNLIYLKTEPDLAIQPLKSKLGKFVLGDSKEPKNTMEILQRCRSSRLKIIEKLQKNNPGLNLLSCGKEVDLTGLNDNEKFLFEGTIHNRNILEKGFIELKKNKMSHKNIGKLLLDQHKVLRDVLQISTPKIENMLDASMEAGALGGKINGSGGGGCMFAYSHRNTEEIAMAIERTGGKAYIIEQDSGVI